MARRGDDLQGFVSAGDNVLVGLGPESLFADDIVEALFVRQLQSSKRIEVDVAYYDL